MRNYMKADLTRIFRRIPRWILIALMLALDVWEFGFSNPAKTTSVKMIDELCTFLKYLPAVLGFIEIGFIFGEDFKGKTAQIAIGTGVTRMRVVFAKWFEAIVICALDTLAFVIIALISMSIAGFAYAPEMTSELIISIIVSIIGVAGYFSIILPILFMSQGTALATLVYMLCSTGLLFYALGFLKYWDAVAWMNLQNYTLTNCLQVFRARMILGSFHTESIIGIVLYLVVPLVLAQLLYRKLELEF